MTASAPATMDAQELAWLAIDAAADLVAADLPAVRYGSPTVVTDEDVLRLADKAIAVVRAVLHGDAVPAVALIQERAQEFLAARTA